MEFIPDAGQFPVKISTAENVGAKGVLLVFDKQISPR
jgi:hypothetical protein